MAGANKPSAAGTGAVLWDLGGVLLDWDPRHLYRKLFGADVAAMDHFLAHVCTPAWHAQQDLGKATAQACAELAAEHPGQAEMIYAWAERNEEMVAGAIDGSVEVLAELRAAGVACYALSNMEQESWQRRLQLYDFLSWFDGCFISSFEGIMKPDPQYFGRALSRFGLRPGDALFIDDRAQNTEVARSLGIPAILFRSPEQLRRDLMARGFLS
ncbi:MAG: HAD family phosphatase [Acidimicrobiales bacterium]|jgi:2-haloacid dehalogenase